MFSKKLDIISIGDLTTDAFIRLKDAHIHGNVDENRNELCLGFGDKVPFESVKIIRAVGNAPTVAVAFSRLGLHSALVSNIGNDENGRESLKELQKNKVITSLVKVHKDKSTNYHFILWYDKDRTILTNHIDYDYQLPKLPESKWIYLSSISENSFAYHMDIAKYLEEHPDIKLAFQPGTFQIHLGIQELRRIYDRTDVLILNMNEAQTLLNSDISLDTKSSIKQLLSNLNKIGPKIVVITDNTNGAYMFDGDHYYHIPMYPDPRPAFERTGCGDAFAATLTTALVLGKSPLEALTWAPINAMSVSQFIGSREGLLSLQELEWWLKKAPSDYKPREI